MNVPAASVSPSLPHPRKRSTGQGKEKETHHGKDAAETQRALQAGLAHGEQALLDRVGELLLCVFMCARDEVRKKNEEKAL